MSATSVDHLSCVVYNSSYEPLSVIRSREAVVHLYEGKATVIEEHPSLVFRSAKLSIPAPTQIVLKEYKRSRPAFRAAAQLTQRNLFVRDKYTCAYCNKSRSNLGHKEFLTRDHIVPLSRGGLDIWTNVVTACNKCNNKKADLMLSECKMVLLRQPKIPSVFELWSKSSKSIKHLPHMSEVC